MPNSVIPAYQFFHDSAGAALDAGYIYVGIKGKNAEAYPKNAFWDEGLTIPAAQPIRTLSGRPVRNGSPGNIYVNGDYSILVKDKNSETVYSALTQDLRLDSLITAASVLIDTDTTFRVPSDFETLQEALDDVHRYTVYNGAKITIELESGFEWPEMVEIAGQDYSHVKITSVDAAVSTAATFPANDALIVFTNCRAPVWEILVDMGGRGDNGVELIDSDMNVTHRKGVINAGANGSPSREGFGSNFLLLGTSNLFCDPVRETVVTRAGVTSAGGTTKTFQLDTADQQALGYWIGHIVTVTGGADSSEAEIIDYDNVTNMVTIRHVHEWSAANNGTNLGYTIELLRGLVATGAARRGITATWASTFSTVAADLRDNGTDNRVTGHSAIFFRRGSNGQADRSTFHGSAAAVQGARAGSLSLRESYFTGVNGRVLQAAEGVSISAAASAFLRCGVIGVGALPDLPILFLASAEGRGGLSTIDAAGGEFDYATGPVARNDSEGGAIDISDSRAFEIESYLATADGGEIDVSGVNGTTKAGVDATHVILASTLNSRVPAFNFTWDAQGGAQYVARAVNSGVMSLASSNIQGGTLNTLDIDEAAQVFFENTTLDGTVVAATTGFSVTPGTSIPTRADAVTLVDQGWFSGDGVSFSAEGRRYVGSLNAITIPDMPGVVPEGDASPAHYSTLGVALSEAANYPLSLDTGFTYNIAAGVTLPAGGMIKTNGATINLTTSIADGTPAFDIGVGSRVIGDLLGTAAAGVGFNRFFRISDSVVEGGVKVTPTDHVPNNNFGHDDLWSGLTQDAAGTYTGAQDIDKADFEAESATWFREDFSFAADVVIGATPSGVIIDGGNAALALWLGFTLTEIVFRVGDSSAATPANCSNLRVDFATACDGATLASRTGTFYGQVDVSTEVIRLWFYDSTERTLYGIGEASPTGTWAPDWTNNVDWGFGQLNRGANVTGETITAFDGTVTSLKTYTSQVDLDFQDVTGASTQATNPDAQNAAVLLISAGGDTSVGDITVGKCDFAVTHNGNDAQNLKIGDVRTENALRALKLESAATVTHGKVAQSGASPNILRGHVSGQQTLLISDVGAVTGDTVISEDTGEHGMRVGFATGDQAPDMTYDTIISRRAGQSGLKIADGQGRAKSFATNAILVEDAGYRPDDTDYNPGLNEAALMMSVEKALIGRFECHPNVMDHCGNHGIDLRGCDEVHIGSTIIEGPDGIGIRAIEEDDGGTDRALTRLHLPEVALKDVNGSAIKIDYRDTDLGDVLITGTVNGCSGDWYVDVDVNTDNMAITGRVFIELWVSGTAPTGLISVTDNAAVPDPNLANFFVVRVNYFDGTAQATYGTAA